VAEWAAKNGASWTVLRPHLVMGPSLNSPMNLATSLAAGRVVTANVDGKSTLQSDEQLPAYQFKSVPDYEHTLVWVNPTTPGLREEQKFDRYPDSVVPGSGGTSLHFVTFPPGSVFADPSFDGEAATSEALIRLKGLADHFEKEDPAMHKTNTVDYSVVYEGEIWLELDDAKTIHLKRGDVVVQNGTRHAWRNKGATPVTMLFFLNGRKTNAGTLRK
jgi:mannose-6-phosphate isomerase-like protein (cupin superfamily)